jgi:hypothetical protein
VINLSFVQTLMDHTIENSNYHSKIYCDPIQNGNIIGNDI